MNAITLHWRQLVGLALLGVVGCAGGDAGSAGGGTVQAFVGARLIDGTGAAPVENSVILVQDGVIQAVGAEGSVEIPANATRIDVTGRTIIPGLINTHGHVGRRRGLQDNQYSRENVLDHLGRYARYGITTVVSLGEDEEEGERIRDENSAADLDRARLYIGGPIIAPAGPEDAAEKVAEAAALNVDWAKIRVEGDGMSPATYQAVIEESHRLGFPVAVHIVDLEDAKGVLRAGADFIAHSVRDLPVDNELITLLRERRVCYCPTLTREISTFIYGSRPDFFDDPFFYREVDPAMIAALEEPARQQAMRESAGARRWEAQLPLAMQNLKALSDAGVKIAMGTDTGGPGARFQGFFEHVEMELMAEAGMTPMQVLVSATSDAAICMGLDQELGTIEPGKRADLVVLQANPLDDIRNTRTIESVWINGNQVPPLAE